MDHPKKSMKIPLREVHLIFSPEDDDDASVSSDGSDDSEDADDEQEDQKPAPSSVVNIIIYNKKTRSNEVFKVLMDSRTLGCLGTAEAVKRAGLKEQHLK